MADVDVGIARDLFWRYLFAGKRFHNSVRFVIGLAVMAFITVFVVYGGIMNFAAWLMDHAMSPQNSALHEGRIANGLCSRRSV